MEGGAYLSIENLSEYLGTDTSPRLKADVPGAPRDPGPEPKGLNFLPALTEVQVPVYEATLSTPCACVFQVPLRPSHTHATRCWRCRSTQGGKGREDGRRHGCEAARDPLPSRKSAQWVPSHLVGLEIRRSQRWISGIEIDPAKTSKLYGGYLFGIKLSSPPPLLDRAKGFADPGGPRGR